MWGVGKLLSHSLAIHVFSLARVDLRRAHAELAVACQEAAPPHALRRNELAASSYIANKRRVSYASPHFRIAPFVLVIYASFFFLFFFSGKTPPNISCCPCWISSVPLHPTVHFLSVPAFLPRCSFSMPFCLTSAKGKQTSARVCARATDTKCRPRSSSVLPAARLFCSSLTSRGAEANAASLSHSGACPGCETRVPYCISRSALWFTCERAVGCYPWPCLCCAHEDAIARA